MWDVQRFTHLRQQRCVREVPWPPASHTDPPGGGARQYHACRPGDRVKVCHRIVCPLANFPKGSPFVPETTSVDHHFVKVRVAAQSVGSDGIGEKINSSVRACRARGANRRCTKQHVSHLHQLDKKQPPDLCPVGHLDISGAADLRDARTTSSTSSTDTSARQVRCEQDRQRRSQPPLGECST